MAADLNALVKKTFPATWSRDQVPEGAVAAFNTLKSALTKAPILGVPIPGYPFKMQTDASESGKEIF